MSLSAVSVKSPTNFAQRLYFGLEVLLRAVNLLMARDPRLYFPSEGSNTQEFYTLNKNAATPAGFEPTNLGFSGEYENTGPPEST